MIHKKFYVSGANLLAAIAYFLVPADRHTQILRQNTTQRTPTPILIESFLASETLPVKLQWATFLSACLSSKFLHNVCWKAWPLVWGHKKVCSIDEGSALTGTDTETSMPWLSCTWPSLYLCNWRRAASVSWSGSLPIFLLPGLPMMHSPHETISPNKPFLL